MDPEDFQTATTEDDPLVQLGLVDFRTGQAVPTSDWAPSGGTGTAPGEGGGSPEQPASTEAPTPAAATPAAASPNWDSDENPYKAQLAEIRAQQSSRDPAADARQKFDQTVQLLNSQRDAAYAQIIAQGLNGQQVAPEVARAMVNALHAEAVANARIEADRAVLMPTAKQAVANEIARKFSAGGVTIKAEELIDLASPDAMEAKAQALAEGRRGANFRARQASGTDRVETGTPAGAVTSRALESLSPQRRIALGLRRGELG